MGISTTESLLGRRGVGRSAYILLFCEFAFGIVFGFGVLKNGLPVRLDI